MSITHHVIRDIISLLISGIYTVIHDMPVNIFGSFSSKFTSLPFLQPEMDFSLDRPVAGESQP
jgi:hypothetical protein